jgi:hypothetical protein
MTAKKSRNSNSDAALGTTCKNSKRFHGSNHKYLNDFSLSLGSLKIAKPFAHVQKVLMHFNRRFKKLSSGDPVPLSNTLPRKRIKSKMNLHKLYGRQGCRFSSFPTGQIGLQIFVLWCQVSGQHVLLYFPAAFSRQLSGKSPLPPAKFTPNPPSLIFAFRP